MRRHILALGSLALMSTAALGQQFPTFERGFAPNKVYSFADVDSINSFNGNLTISIPVSLEYPLNSSFQYGLTLHYNSKVWDYEEIHSGGTKYSRAVPNRDSNAGMGWIVDFGRLASPGDSANTALADQWTYLSPDGSRHLIAGALHANSDATTLSGTITSADYSRDGSYYRMLTNSDGSREVDTPDGLKRTFDPATGTMQQMTDAFGNSVAILVVDLTANLLHPPPCADGDVLAWRLLDSAGRTNWICFEDSTYPESAYDNLMIESIVVAAPGNTTATYTFSYSSSTDVQRGCHSNVPNDSPTISTPPMLSGITLPDGSSYSFTYNYQDNGYCDQGTLASMSLPTGASIAYTYRFFQIPVTDCGNSQNVFTNFSSVTGVGQRQTTGPTGFVSGTWTWVSSAPAGSDYVQCPIGTDGTSYAYFHAPADTMTVAVTEPSGNVTEHYYSVWPGTAQLYVQNADGSHSAIGSSPYPAPSENGVLMTDYGLPFTRSVSSDSFFLSTRRYSQTGYAANPRSSSRSEYATYEYEPLASTCTSADSACLGQPSNQRPSGHRTVYVDDGNRTADIVFTNFDGFGHYRQTATDGSFGSGNVRTSFANYNPASDANGNAGSAFAIPAASNWILGTYTDQWIQEDSHTAKTENCFDANGTLTAKRILKNDATSADRIAESTNDVLIGYEADSAGNVVKEKYYGGDTCAAAVYPITGCSTTPSCPPVTGKVCTASSGLTPTYDLHHTYSYGVLESSQFFECDDTTAISFKSVDRTIDRAGVVAKERDTASHETTFTYDTSGRILTVSPPDENQVSYTYTNASISNNVLTPAMVTATRDTQESEYQYDAMGRLWREKHLMPGSPDNSWSLRETLYDGTGRKVTVSGFETIPGGSNPANEFGFTPAHHTSFSYDAFDRPVTIVAPDGETTSISYQGVSTVTQTVNIAEATASGLSEVGVKTKKVFDRQGRLSSITEGYSVENPTTPDGRVTTSYKYDVGNRLASVAMPGPQGTQSRSFNYDNRGFLTSETHPEIGTGGNGSVSHLEYDPRGHAHRTTTSTLFNVRTFLDPAERPVEVQDVHANQDLKQFTYDTGGACTGTNCNGKLVTATRWNTDPDLGRIAVTETYQYDSTTGRTTRRDRSAGATAAFTGDTFSLSQTYNANGDVDTLNYPCRLDANGVCLSTERARSAVHGYSLGLLTSVQPSSGTVWASSITYQQNGTIGTVTHGSGTSAVQERWAADPNGLPRPRQITATNADGSTTLYDSGQYAFDGAGNVKQIGTTVYGYDVFNRLSSWTIGPRTGSYTTTSLGYDVYGNQLYTLNQFCTLVGARQVCGSNDVAPIKILGTTNHYASYTYDDAGNVTSDGKRTFTYDPLNMMTREQASGRDFRFLYSADDERIAAVERVQVGSTTKNKTTWTLRGFDNHVLSIWTDDGTGATRTVTWKEDEIFRGGDLLANESSAGTRHYVLDHLSSPRALFNSSGQLLGPQDFAPFGTGGTSNGGALQFTGHERDQANLTAGAVPLSDYAHARYYSSPDGRFLSLDPVFGNVQAPQSLNRYSYVSNNPIRFIDRTGQYVCDGTAKQCQAFEDARKANLASTRASQLVKDASKAYGTLGEKNGIVIGFGPTSPGKGAEAELRLHAIVDANGTATVRAEGTVTVNPTLLTPGRGDEFAAAVAHEGVHVFDAQALAASYQNDGSHNAALDLTGRQTEFNAYRATADVATMTNGTFPFDGATFRPTMPARELDRVIRNILATSYDPDYLANPAFPWQ